MPARSLCPSILLALCFALAHHVGAAAQAPALAEKTLVAWVAPANSTLRGASVLTLDDRRGPFDGIVFGELEPARWMAGSDPTS
jgi:hypothetical protein